MCSVLYINKWYMPLYIRDKYNKEREKRWRVMNILERVSILAKVINYFEDKKIEHRKLQKIICILQGAKIFPNIYDFKIGNSGIISYLVTLDIELGEKLEILKTKRENSELIIISDELKPEEFISKDSEALIYIDEIQNQKNIIESLSNEDITVLEIIATYFYLQEKNVYEESEIANKLRDVDKHLTEYFEDAKDASKVFNKEFSSKIQLALQYEGK